MCLIASDTETVGFAYADGDRLGSGEPREGERRETKTDGGGEVGGFAIGGNLTTVDYTPRAFSLIYDVALPDQIPKTRLECVIMKFFE